MTEDIQHTLSVTELLNEKIAIGKEVLKEKEKAYYTKISYKSINEITEGFKYLGILGAYLFLGFIIIALSLFILIVIGSTIFSLLPIGSAIEKYGYYVSLFVMVFASLVALYCIKKAYSFGVLRNPLSPYLREFSNKKDIHSYSSQL